MSDISTNYMADYSKGIQALIKAIEDQTKATDRHSNSLARATWVLAIVTAVLALPPVISFVRFVGNWLT